MGLEGDTFIVEPVKPEDNIPQGWLMRPCEWYKDEYKECSSIKGRIHQYFIFGHNLDCSSWNKDYNNCILFRKTRGKEAIQSVVESEKRRYEERMKSSQANDAWTYRKTPPEWWNNPLPDYLQDRYRGTYLEFVENRRRGDAINEKRKMKETPDKTEEPKKSWLSWFSWS